MGVRRRRTVQAAAMIAVLSPPAFAASAPTAAPAVHVHDHTHHHHGQTRITLDDGATFTIHGYEPRTPEWLDPTVIRASHGTDMGPGDPERAPVCATDYYQHVLYAQVAIDHYAVFKTRIQSAIRRMNHVLNEEALASGGRTADFKVLCDGTGQIQVDRFTAIGTEFQTIVQSARLAGFTNPNADYTIFYDGPHPLYCGVGSFSSDERLIAGNANNAGGGYAITYNGCWDGRTPMHENGHNQGAVQYSAPNSTGSGAHCNDQIDVMCYSDGGDRDVGDFTACSDRIHYDCNNDTYFDAGPEAGEWLSSHWNIGSPLNRFIVLGP